MAKLTFFGATDGVTGSAYLLQTGKRNLLLECGLFQGTHEEEKANADPFPFDARGIDAVILSHAHLDHSGRLPRLVAQGFSGPVYMTNPTCDLLEVMLMDAAHLQQRDAEWENRCNWRASIREITPLYTLDDVDAALMLCQGVNYGRRQEVVDGIEVCFRDAGHILGSAIVEIFITEFDSEKKLVFSGDLGNGYAALLRDPEIVSDADLLLLESTYGDRDHRSMDETLGELEDITRRASANGGNILIPAFAVGRTQEIIFRLGELYQDGGLRQEAVFLDSPMAITVTEIYHRYQYIFNDEDRSKMRIANSANLRRFLPILHYTRTTEESMVINSIESGAIIIAGSGMCDGGRIRHHLKHNLWRERTHVIICGYQAIGTPGRALVDGAQTFAVGNESIAVHASIHTLGGFSAHAGQAQLLEWAEQFSSRPAIYLVHGEADAKYRLRTLLAQRGFDVNLAAYADTVTI